MEGICVNFLDQVQFFRFLKRRCHGNQFCVIRTCSLRAKVPQDLLDRFSQSLHRMNGRWSIRPSFSDILRNVAMATTLVGKMRQNYLPPALIVLSFRKILGYRYLNVRINSVNEASIVWKFREIRSGNFRDDRAYLWTSGTTRSKNWRISLNISGYTGRTFAIFSPYESDLRADDGSVPHFPIFQGTLPWQPNNLAKML